MIKCCLNQEEQDAQLLRKIEEFKKQNKYKEWNEKLIALQKTQNEEDEKNDAEQDNEEEELDQEAIEEDNEEADENEDRDQEN